MTLMVSQPGPTQVANGQELTLPEYSTGTLRVFCKEHRRQRRREFRLSWNGVQIAASRDHHWCRHSADSDCEQPVRTERFTADAC